MKKLNVLSLFDGISCGMVALEKANIHVNRYVAYEIEKHAISISKYNYPSIEHCGDVIGEDFSKYKGFDLLIGGSPCQSLSIVQSKTRENLNGKSKLFFEFVRAKEEMQPRWFLFENVASMNEESKNIISSLLGCQPVLIDSADFSAQSRPRLYWTNIPQLKEHKKSNKVLKDIMCDSVEEKYYYTCDYKFHGEDKSIAATLDIKGHDILKRVHSKYFKCHTLTTCGGGNTQKKVFDNGRPRKLTPLEYERLQTLPDNYTLYGNYDGTVKKVADTNRYNTIGNGWTAEVIAYLLSGIHSIDLEQGEDK